LASAGLLLILPSALAVASAPSTTNASEIESGRQLFIRCIACHALSTTARGGTGPHLEGIIGRKVASVPNFRYSPQLRAQDFVWTGQKLERWLRKQQALVPDMCMPFKGLSSRSDRAALVAYLGTRPD